MFFKQTIIINGGWKTLEYVDWSKAKMVVFPNLKPTHKSISLRLPAFMLDQIKVLANKKDVPYQSLMKVYLAEKIKEEMA